MKEGVISHMVQSGWTDEGRANSIKDKLDDDRNDSAAFSTSVSSTLPGLSSNGFQITLWMLR